MLETMFLRNRLLYIIGGGLLGAFLVAVLGCSFAAMPMYMSSYDMTQCDESLYLIPYVVSTKDQRLDQLLSLMVTIVLFTAIAWPVLGILRITLALLISRYFFKQLRILALLHDHLLIAFQRGILHPKIY